MSAVCIFKETKTGASFCRMILFGLDMKGKEISPPSYISILFRLAVSRDFLHAS